MTCCRRQALRQNDDLHQKSLACTEKVSISLLVAPSAHRHGLDALSAIALHPLTRTIPVVVGERSRPNDGSEAMSRSKKSTRESHAALVTADVLSGSEVQIPSATSMGSRRRPSSSAPSWSRCSSRSACSWTSSTAGRRSSRRARSARHSARRGEPRRGRPHLARREGAACRRPPESGSGGCSRRLAPALSASQRRLVMRGPGRAGAGAPVPPAHPAHGRGASRVGGPAVAP